MATLVRVSYASVKNMHDAVDRCDAAKVKLLLAAYPHAHDREKLVYNTDLSVTCPLHSAIEKLDVKIVKIIADSGVDVTKGRVGVLQETALVYAVGNNDLHLVKVILKSIADVRRRAQYINEVNAEGKTAMDMTANAEMRYYLKELGGKSARVRK